MGVGAADVVDRLAAMTLQEPFEPKHVEPFLRRKAALQEEIETLQHQLDALKTKRKETPHHIRADGLPEEARLRQLSSQSKHLVCRGCHSRPITSKGSITIGKDWDIGYPAFPGRTIGQNPKRMPLDKQTQKSRPQQGAY